MRVGQGAPVSEQGTIADPFAVTLAGKGDPRAHGTSSHSVKGGVHHYPMEPGGHGRFTAEGLRTSIGGDQGVLEGV
jgi:hypothetical protein